MHKHLPALLVLVASYPSQAAAQWAGEWKLDETTGTTANDISGNANHGTLKNFSGTPWIKGKFGNALSFDGVDDYVEVNIKKQLPVYDAMGSPYSIVYWIKAPAQHDKRAYAEGYSRAGTGFGALITLGSGRTSNTTTDKFQIYIRNDAGRVVCNGYSNSTVYDDTWHHVAWIDVSGTITLYVDGVKDTSNITYRSGSEPGTVNFGKFTMDKAAIGAVLRQSACCLMKGALDDVRVYDFALSAADVGLVMLNVPSLPCRASVGKFGHGCAGTLAITATGSARFGQTLTLQLSKGTPNAAALLFVGLAGPPLDLSIAGFTGCLAYPSFTGSILAGVGALDSTGSSAKIPITIPTLTSLACVIGAIQGVAISGTRLELSAAILAQLGS